MKQIPLSGKRGIGLFALVDDGDYLAVEGMRWNLQKVGYARHSFRENGKVKVIYLHHFIVGKPLQRFEVDHIDGDRLNNTRANLRFVSPSQNQHRRLPTVQVKENPPSSCYKGVSWYKRDKKWYAHICFDNKSIHLGCFTDESEAARAYDEAALRFFGRYARTNF